VTPLVEMRNINVSFGGVHAVRDASIELYPARSSGWSATTAPASRRSCASCRAPIRPTVARSHQRRAGDHRNPRDAKDYAIETIYQTLALADNLDAPGNLFLGREPTTLIGQLDDSRWNPRRARSCSASTPTSRRFKQPVVTLSGGQRQAIAIARAVYFNARILIMDEPTAALGPTETAQVHALIRQLVSDGIGIFLISHDIHDVFDLSDRISVMYQGRIIQTVNREDVTTDDVLSMIIIGQQPAAIRQSRPPAAARSTDGSGGA
jgi:D-xylose transport system ATP-binding protein